MHTVIKSSGQSGPGKQGSSAEQVLDGLYVGPKSAFRPIHDALLSAARDLGGFEEASKKTYVSYRRKRQFTMIGPATNTRVEVGLNMKGLEATDRLQELPSGQMCNYIIQLKDVIQVDAEPVMLIKIARDAAG